MKLKTKVKCKTPNTNTELSNYEIFIKIFINEKGIEIEESNGFYKKIREYVKKECNFAY